MKNVMKTFLHKGNFDSHLLASLTSEYNALQSKTTTYLCGYKMGIGKRLIHD